MGRTDQRGVGGLIKKTRGEHGPTLREERNRVGQARRGRGNKNFDSSISNTQDVTPALSESHLLDKTLTDSDTGVPFTSTHLRHEPYRIHLTHPLHLRDGDALFWLIPTNKVLGRRLVASLSLWGTVNIPRGRLKSSWEQLNLILDASLSGCTLPTHRPFS